MTWKPVEYSSKNTSPENCPRCGGTGVIITHDYIPNGPSLYSEAKQQPCTYCNETGLDPNQDLVQKRKALIGLKKAALDTKKHVAQVLNDHDLTPEDLKGVQWEE